MEDEVLDLLFEEFSEDAESIIDDYNLDKFDNAESAVAYIETRERWRGQPVTDQREAEYEERVLLGEEEPPRR